MPETKFKFKLGSDPEFSFTLQGRRIDAYNLLQTNLLRKKGFCKRNSGFDCAGGNVGWDGCQATAEIRPLPSNSLTEITNNIKTILVETHKQTPTFDMSVLSTFAPVGGHIHFQITEDLHRNQRKLQLINKKMSSFYLPILISENKINLRLRSGDQGGGYGTLTDFHGDNSYETPTGREYTYEFRTPSAEWLCSEKICNATFAYMAAIYNEILYQPQNFRKYMDIVYKNNEQAKALHQLAITNYIGITEGVFDRIKKAVRTFELYPEFKEQIEYILNPKKVANDKKKTNYNIVEGWNLSKISNITKPTLKEIVNEKKFKQRAAAIDLDKVTDLMNISYNDDINVDFFVKVLSERSAAFGWKLKHNYFIFGLKKGVDKTLIFNEEHQIMSGKDLIKTASDAEAMDKLMKRISKKFLQYKSKTIDPITGTIEKIKTIVIGLPYEMRISKKPKEFIKLIYRLEENKLKAEPVEVANKNLVDDTGEPDSRKGIFWRYVHGVKIEQREEMPGVVFDDHSQGSQIAARNTQVIIQNEINDEQNNSEDEPEEPINEQEPYDPSNRIIPIQQTTRQWPTTRVFMEPESPLDPSEEDENEDNNN